MCSLVLMVARRLWLTNTRWPQLAQATPASAVARALSAGAYVPETAGGAELVSYLAQLDDAEYAVVNEQGLVTGLLSQATVVAAITGKPES